MTGEGFGKKMMFFFRSMRLRVFLVVVFTGLAASLSISFVSMSVVRSEAVRQRKENVGDYSEKLSLKLENDVYSVNFAQLPDVSHELDTVSAMYEGRIIVTDARLEIVYDSYDVEGGKTLISKEAINALKGEISVYIDTDDRFVEVTRPIGNNPVQGVLIVIASTSDCYELSSILDTRIQIVAVAGGVFLFLFAVLFARSLTKPFGRITQSLHHISEGYTGDTVNIGGFSELDRVSDSFNEMLGRINTLEDSRQEFVSNVSHELKTPITSVKVLAESLLNQPNAPVEMYREFMADINDEIDRESKIINDLLALVRLDRKSGDMHIAQVSINELLDLLVKRLKPIAETSGIELIFESYRDVLAEVDEVKLSLALSNLIENGIKYNREGGSVRIQLNADHRFFLVRVADTGIGIPEAALDRIFDRFYRVDKMRSRETGGTGLGLSITRSVVLMHHGSVKVESAEGEGTVFTVRIPLSYIPETKS